MWPVKACNLYHDGPSVATDLQAMICKIFVILL